MFKKEIHFEPGFDRRDPDPNKNYGIRALGVGFYLIGEKATIQFKFSTGMYPKHLYAEWHNKNKCYNEWPDYMASDIGYHAYEPQYEGQEPISQECHWTQGKPCYYDGSGLQADKFLEALMADGEDKVWEMMEEYYVGWGFGESTDD
jgi:hypothetical protein